MTNARRSLRKWDVAAAEILKKMNKERNCFRSLGGPHGGQTQLCRRALGRGYLDWMLCKVRIVWTRLICRGGCTLRILQGAGAMEEGGSRAGRCTLLLKQGFGRRFLQPATCHRSIHNKPTRIPFTLPHTQTLPAKTAKRGKLTRTQRRRNSHGTVSGVGR